MNREIWLLSLTKKLQPIFEEFHHKVPENIRIACGFPSRGIRSNSIGECWSDEASEDHTHEIFIHPKLIEPIQIAGVLVHELVHSIVGVKEKHGKVFKKLATKIGLEGKMTATYPGLALTDKLNSILKDMEKYPHGKLSGSVLAKKVRGKNSFKVSCECGFSCKVGKKFMDLELPKHCDKTMELDDSEVGEE